MFTYYYKRLTKYTLLDLVNYVWWAGYFICLHISRGLHLLRQQIGDRLLKGGLKDGPVSIGQHN